MPKTIATICARGGSEGLPGKNIKPFNGTPLIVWTIEQAKKCKLIDAVYVSTDDPRIAHIASEAGARVPYLRPRELATSEAGKLPVIQHLVEYIETLGLPVDRIVDLQPTTPLRELEDIESSINLLDEDTDVVITAYQADQNPYFNMVEVKDGYAALVKPSNAVSRQQAPHVFTMNGAVYVWHRKTLDKGLWGKTKVHVMPKNRSVDIDDEIDFLLAEKLAASKSMRDYVEIVAREWWDG